MTQPTCITIQSQASVDDAYIQANALTKNDGSQPILRVSAKDESLLRFDLGAVPSNAAISRATLHLYANGDAGDGTIEVHRALVPWSESSVTFASFAQKFASDASAAFKVESKTAGKSIELTSLVTSWLSGAHPNYGMALIEGPDHHGRCDRDEDEDHDPTVFVSSESASVSKRPALEVCYVAVADHCAPNPCGNGGTCVNGSNGFTCQCPAGFTGVTCQTNIDDCAGSPCQNGGACQDGVGTYTCSCPVGYTGANCETNIDDCSPNPCQNGAVCTDGVASFTCACAPGYDGATCDHLIDNCASLPCHNGGTCNNAVDGYTCACATGFSGSTCDVNVDDCVANACANGTCIDGINSYTCSCAPDWGGDHCDVNLNSCGQNPCLNGATCANGFGSYTCACAPGYSGTNCEVDINDCAANPCENGGLCVDGVNAFTCMCASGFTGPTCDTNVDDCASVPCHNGGTCTDAIASFTCACPAAWSGPTCDVVVDACAAQPCGNGGSCTTDANGPGTYSCTCPTNFGGQNCELDASDGFAVTVPNVPSDPSIPHVILSGVVTTLKGRGLGPVTEYMWDFGDGTPNTGWANIVADQDFLGIVGAASLSAKHTYQGNPGQVFIATLSVRATTTSAAHSAAYPMMIADPTNLPDPHGAIAIDEGLWFLHTHLSRHNGTNGIANAYDDSRGCATTAAFERHGSSVTGSVFTDPYSDDVQRLLVSITGTMDDTYPAAYFTKLVDLNGNGVRIVLDGGDQFELGMCSDALAQTPRSYVARSGGVHVVGRTLGDLAQDLADAVLSQQGPSGGFNFDPFITYGGSRALTNLQRLGAVVPSQAFADINTYWVGERFHYGTPACGAWPEAGYGSMFTAAYTYDERLAGIPASQLEPGFGYLDTHWTEATFGCSSEEQATVLALQEDGVELLAPYACDGTQTAPGFDWYADPTSGLVHLLVARQAADGSWVDSSAPGNNGCNSQTAITGTTANTISMLIGM